MASLIHAGKRIAPWRFLMFFALLVVGVAIAVGPMDWSKGILAGFDAAAVAFLASCIPTFGYDAKTMRKVAAQNDANRLVMLVLSFLMTVVILSAVLAELDQKQALGPWDNDANRAVLLVITFLLTVVIMAAVVGELSLADKLDVFDKLLVAASLVLVWMFANAVYTLHYTHLFYTADDGGKDQAGLKFPGTKEPLMSDFVYFAYTLGVALQTADVEVTSPHIRKVVTAHCVAGFFFNLGVLALTINVLGSS